MGLAGFRQINGALGRASQRRFVDLEARDLTSENRIFQPALLVGAYRIRSDLTERPADTARRTGQADAVRVLEGA